MKPRVLALILLGWAASACGPSNPAPPAMEWTKPLSIYGAHLVHTRDGGFVACGAREPEGDGVPIPGVVRLDSTFRESWSRTYERPPGAGFGLEWIDETTDGGFVAVGSTAEWASKESDVCLLRLDPRGAPVWKRTYGGPDWDCAANCAGTTEGDFIIAGATGSFGAGRTDGYVLRVDRSGQLLWQKTFGAESYEGTYEDGMRVFQTRDRGFVVVGSSDSKSLIPAGASVAVYLVKIDANGEKLWERTYGTAGGFDTGRDVRELDDGGLAVSALRENKFHGLWLLRTDEHGLVRWEKTVEAAGAHGMVPLAVISTGDFILGNRINNGSGETDAYLLKIGPSGKTIWEKRFGIGGYHRVLSITEVGGGPVVLCAGPDWEPYAVKLAADGSPGSS